MPGPSKTNKATKQPTQKPRPAVLVVPGAKGKRYFLHGDEALVKLAGRPSPFDFLRIGGQ